MTDRPNVLYLHSHDTGRYVQPYGHAVHTPNMQRLAEQGVLFRQAFCAAPTCSPSRAALLTGQWAHCSGMIGLAHRGFGLTDYNQHLVHTLQGAGYHTALCGVQHEAADAAAIGYHQTWTDRTAAAVVANATAFLRGAPRRPFFLSAGFEETHRVYPQPGPLDDARFCLPPATVPDTPAVRADMAAFKASARILDESMGAVLRALADAGLSDNTLVVCTTDHGIAFPGMKCNLTVHGTGVMLIMRGPGAWRGGRVCDALVSHVDIFPTICEQIGIAPPAWLAGRSLLPLVRGDLDEIREETFAEVTYHAAYEPQRAVRTKRWLYIRRFDGRSRPVLPNCDDSPSKNAWLAAGWATRPPAAEQLYDLQLDPCESYNLAGHPPYRAVQAEMAARLQRWMQATDDPLLYGPVPAPKGARVNDPDGLSPSEPPTIA